MSSILTSYTSQSARDSSAPASSNTGLCIFRTDTKAIEVSDGTNYLTYTNDGVLGSGTFTSNTHSALFDGTNDYIDTGNKFDFIQQTCNFSISFWIKFTDHTSTANNQYIIHTSDSNGRVGFMFYYDNRSSTGNNKTLITVVSTTTGVETPIAVNNGITDDNWHHIAVTCADGGFLKLYKDGNVIGSTSAPTPVATTALQNLTIGGALNASGNLVIPFAGYLDEVAIFNRELTNAEISNIINNKSYTNFFAMYRLENNADDENGVNNGTNFTASFEAKADDATNTPY